MKKFLLAVFLLTCCAMPASAASFEELTPYLSTQYYTWREYYGGRRLLKESGPLFSGGILVGFSTDSSLTFRAKAELFGGVVDYNGETQPPDPVAMRTHVGYFGVREQADLGYRFTSGQLRIEPFGGVGYRWWLRDLQDGTSATGQPVSGYTESWQIGYGRLGARGRYLIPSGVSIFAEGGAMYPFYVGNTVDFVSSGTMTFRPSGELSGFAETGVKWKHLKLALSYEGMRFGQSPFKSVATKYYFQPHSSSDSLSLNLGWAFR